MSESMMVSLIQDLAARHRAMCEAGPSATEIANFILELRQAGSVIGEKRDRMAAGRMLSSWIAEAIRRNIEGARDMSPALDPFISETQSTFEQTTTFARERAFTDEELSKIAESRALLRISGQARQWRETKSAGYLLNGKALKEAELYADQDEDIKHLVNDSRRAETRWRTLWRILGGLVLLGGVFSYGITSEYRTRVATRLAEKQTELAEAQTELTDIARREADDARADRDRLAGERLTAQNERDALVKRYREELDEVNKEKAELDKRLGDYRQRYGEPAEIIPEALLTGYSPSFLGAPIPMPGVGERIRNTVFDGGRPLALLHFSTVMQTVRRMPLFAASNFDRAQRRPLVRPLLIPAPETRVPAAVQPDPRWFRPPIDRGHLVTAEEIAWGAEFSGSGDANGKRAFSAIDMSLNLTPQLVAFNRGVWSQLEAYSLDGFAPGAPRISIFSGPVFADDDPLFNGVKLPRAFWKILVARKADGSFLTEAYLLPQIGDDAPDAKDGSGFKAQSTSVAVIEKLTGLIFAPAMRESDVGGATADPPKYTQQLSPAVRLADRVPLIDGDTPEVRASAVKALLDAWRNGVFRDRADQKQIVQALLALSVDPAYNRLSQNGRYNLALVLRSVPAEVWQSPPFRDLRNLARRAVGDIRLGPDAQASPRTLELLKALDAPLGLGDGRGLTVPFQFAGMTRGNAQDISQRLQVLGWKIDGEQRKGSAAKVNEVRYAAADRDAAQQIADDLSLIRQRKILAVANSQVKAGSPEVWISD